MYHNAVAGSEARYPRIHSIFTAFEETYDKSFDFAGEKHDFWEAVCVLGGRAVVTADSMVYTLESGEVILHPPMRFHKIAADGEALRVIIFSFAATGDMTRFENGVFRLSRGARVLAEELPPLFLRCGEEDAAHMLVNTAERFLLTLRRAERTSAPVQHRAGAIEFKTIVDTMEAHLAEKLSVGELAELCRLSRANMKKIFYRYTGTGIMKYFNGLKIERAAELLREGKRIAEISDSLGFDNQNYFSTVFKREKGISPSAYRRKFFA